MSAVESPPPPPPPPPARSRRPLASPAVRGWIVATTVYITAVFHRSSLGVAGLEAAHRFGITPAQLSVFVLLQLGVYAAMQIPTGVLVDRFGPRRLLVAAAGTMALAQLSFAVAPDYGTALLARALLGCGDALTFVSVLRFAAAHFRPRHYPLIVAATGVLGSVGNVLATLPLSLVLRGAGWTPTFAGAALVSGVAAVVVWFVLPESVPSAGQRRSLMQLREPARRVAGRVALAWATPGTRLGFWVHFSSMSTATAFGLLWGVPYLVAQGYSQQAASTVLLVCVAVGVVASPATGLLISRHPAARVPLAIAVCTTTVTGWAALLSIGGEHPSRLLVDALCVFSALGPPVSAIGFALARDYNRSSIVGTATGVVNVGGFVASIVGSALVGIMLDLSGSSSRSAFRAAFAVMICVQLVGTVQVVRWWLRARAASIRAQRRGEPVPVPIVVHRWDIVTGGTAEG